MKSVSGWLGSFLAVIVLAVTGCGRLAPVNLVAPGVEVPEKRVVVFFVDGLSAFVTDEMLAAGELPAIQKYFRDGGVWVERSVTVAPSITYAVTVSLATGMAPGHHGVLGNRYFDPQRLAFVNYGTMATYRHVDRDFTAPTLYERAGDVMSVTIQTPLRRGAYRPIDNWASSGIRWWFGEIMEIDTLTAERFYLIGDEAAKAGRWPGLIFAYFPAVDEMGHRYGPGSSQYRAAARNADEQIGRICEALEASGLLEGGHLVLVSDHGMAPCEADQWLDVRAELAETFDLRVSEGGPGPGEEYAQRAVYYREYDAVTTNGGNRRVGIYLRGDGRWEDAQGRQASVAPLAAKVARHFGRLEAVDVAAWRDEGFVGVAGEQGTGRIESRGDGPLNEKSYRYVVVDGADPLDYAGEPLASGLLDGQWHTAAAWLTATAATGHPDAVVALATMFESPRAGEVMVFAAQGWDFSRANVGGHGGLLALEMRTVMAASGPGLKAGGRLETARVVDVAPTIWQMLGVGGGEAALDGQSLLEQSKRAPETGAKRQ